MKTYRIACLNLAVDISMPSILFWFFKRYAKIKTREDKTMKGREYDFIVFDEAATFLDTTQEVK